MENDRKGGGRAAVVLDLQSGWQRENSAVQTEVSQVRKGKYQVRKILEFELGSAQNRPIRVRGRRGLTCINTGARRLDIYSDVPGIISGPQ